MENKMLLTVVEISDKQLWDGAKVRNKISGKIRTVKIYPEEFTISQAVSKGLFNPNENIDYQTLMLNKSRFELVEEISEEDLNIEGVFDYEKENDL